MNCKIVERFLVIQSITQNDKRIVSENHVLTTAKLSFIVYLKRDFNMVNNRI